MIRWAVFTILLLLADAAMAMQITEIMYNPVGDDNGKEYAELFDENLSDLSGFFIMDSATNDTLTQLRIGNSSYAFLLEEDANLADFNLSPDVAVYTTGPAIGNGLGNSGDSLSLYDPHGNFQVRASYDGSLANGNGRSLVFVDQQWGESAENSGSPGRANMMFSNPETICIANFSLTTDKDLYNDGEKVLISFVVAEDVPFAMQYWVEDLHGNIMRAKRNTTNANAKTFIAHSDEADQVLLIKAVYSACNNTIIQDRQIVVRGSGIPENSSLKILDAPERAIFGSTIPIELEIFRSNTRKTAVEISIEHEGIRVGKPVKISSPTTLGLVLIPLEFEIYSNCDGKYPEGTYSIVAVGLDTSTSVPIILQTENCEPEVLPVPKQLPLALTLTDCPGSAQAGEAYPCIITLENPNRIESEVEVWSYLYRGSEAITEREENRQSVHVPPMASTEISLEHVLDNVREGNATLKVRLLEKGKKTPRDFRQTVSIINDAQETSPPIAVPVQHNQTAAPVYYSKNADIRRLSIWVLLTSCFLVISLLVWRGK
ncbi:MAG TPA: hypothetical protein VJK52_05955 [Candidatus Nanoarchaeia archaeon]|nr:hypothetical protein [Candidatus Nanoarchaeia archaeon]